MLDLNNTYETRHKDGDPLDILLVEDDPAYARIVNRYFRDSRDRSVNVSHVGALEEALRRMEETGYSLILSDLGLGDSEGMDTVERLFSASPGTPLVVLTANDNSELAMQAMQCGAQDYLVKGDFDAKVLSRVVRYAIERKRAHERIAYLAHHDTVTGLPNRVLFRDRLDQVIASCQRHGTSAAVHFLDLDRFKEINDTLGHYVGDELLKQVAERLQKTIRTVDTAARIGGDEFVIVETDVDEARDAATLAEKIVDAFEVPFDVQGNLIKVRATLGIAVYPNDGETADDLLRSADLTLNSAKKEFKGHYLFFNAGMRANLEKQREIEQELDRALENDDFELHFQPKYNMTNDLPVGVEALVRWRHHQGVMVPPNEFIPVAEASGQIKKIGEWIIDRACHDGARMVSELNTPLTVAINLSPLELKDSRLKENIDRALTSSGFPPELLEIEMTETAMVEGDPTDMCNMLAELREYGIGLAIDDFGTGYASLSQLLKYPFTCIKIDRSFVSGIGNADDKTEIVRAILSLGRGLSKTVVAEGIEDNVQAAFLMKEGCPVGQGFGYSKPLPFDELKTEINRRVELDRKSREMFTVDPALEASLQVA